MRKVLLLRRAAWRLMLVLGGLSLFAFTAEGSESGWLQVDTAHFSVYSNAEPDRAAEIAEDLELFRKVLQRLSSGLDLESVVPSTVIVFRDADSYRPYRSVSTSEGDGIQGQYLSRPEVAFLTLNADAPGAAAVEVAFHEYVHDILRRNLPGLPGWFEEGLAEYYSSLTVTGDRVLLGRPIQRHLNWWQQSGGAVASVLDDAVDPQVHDRKPKGQPFYSVSWALVHYLFASERDLAAELADYLALLLEGEDPSRALRDAFSLKLDQLDEVLAQHVLQPDFPVSTLPLQNLGEAPAGSARWIDAETENLLLGHLQLALGRLEDSRAHFQTADSLAPSVPGTVSGLGAVMDFERRLEEGALLYADAIARGADDPVTFLRFGRNRLLLAQSGAADLARRKALCFEAVAWFDRAVAEFPRYAEAHALAGAAYLLGDLDNPEKGVHYLRKAKSLIPNRADWTAQEVKLLLRSRNVEEARRVLSSSTWQFGDGNELQVLSDEVDRMFFVVGAEKAFNEGLLKEGLRLYDQAIGLTADEDLRQRMEMEMLRLQAESESRD